MKEWCIAHPYLTFFIIMSLLPSYTFVWHKTRKKSKP